MQQQRLTGSTGASTSTLVSARKCGFGRQSAHNVSHDLQLKMQSQASKQKLSSKNSKGTNSKSGKSVPKNSDSGSTKEAKSSKGEMPLKVI
jgi:hypothetical protein